MIDSGVLKHLGLSNYYLLYMTRKINCTLSSGRSLIETRPTINFNAKKFLVCNISFFIFSCVSVVKNIYIKCNSLISLCCSLHTACRDPEFLLNVGKCVCVFYFLIRLTKSLLLLLLLLLFDGFKVDRLELHFCVFQAR